MKKVFFLLSFLLTIATLGFAQRFAYVDTQYILNNIPDYTDAQKKLDEISAGWQKDIEAKYKEIDNLNKSYQQEQVLLTDDMKQQRLKEIAEKEKAVKEYQKQKYGPEGELFQKRQELIKPIQDKVYDAISKIAAAKGYDFIFDKSSGVSMLYANPKLDLSDQVIAQMGYSPKTLAAPTTKSATDANKSTNNNKTNTTNTNTTTPTTPKTNSPTPTPKQ